MRETRRYVQLQLVLSGKLDAGVMAEIRRPAADIHGDIENPAAGNTHQLALGMVELVMQPPEYAAPRTGMIVLHKYIRYSEFGIPAGMVGLKEKAARITMHIGLDQQQLWMVCRQ